MLPNDSGGGAGARSGRRGNVMALTLENPDGAFDEGSVVSSQFARTWIVDEDRIPVICDGELSRFLVKL